MQISYSWHPAYRRILYRWQQRRINVHERRRGIFGGERNSGSVAASAAAAAIEG